MSEAVNEAESLDVMSSVRRKVSTGKPAGRSMTGGVDKLILTASLRVDKPKINISFPEKPALVEATDMVEDIEVASDQPKVDADKTSDAKVNSPKANGKTKVVEAAAEDVPADDTQVKSVVTEDIDDRDILTSEPSVLKTDGLIDEDMLRDMISDIVREELQGDLGEKITRNVRRLVRREIHRTMVSNQLE